MKLFLFLFLSVLTMKPVYAMPTDNQEFRNESDASINGVYNQVIAELSRQGNDQAVENLKRSELAWIKSRDLYCQFIGQYFQDNGGINYYVEESTAREKMLKKVLTQIRRADH